MANKPMLIISEQIGGVISKDTVYVCAHNEYLYISNSVKEVIDLMANEWEHDRHLVG